ncbi:MAG: hypothetical protein KAT28_05325 [Candidatus Aenigmarchaeota archaeon]|nr:hypothetical protein [Candidatus Aenigmarchaeota archaeon]
MLTNTTINQKEFLNEKFLYRNMIVEDIGKLKIIMDNKLSKLGDEKLKEMYNTSFECPLIINFLKGMNLSKKELMEKLSCREKEFMGKFAHSKSTFYYWLKRLREWNMVREVNNMVSLTKLGEWISNASGDEFVIRFNFVEKFICNSCSSESTVVIFKPIIKNLHISKENGLDIKVKCPICKKETWIYANNWKTDDNWKNFYNNSIDDLKNFMKVNAEKI